MLSLTNIALALFVLLQSFVLIGHRLVSDFVIGVVGFAFVVLLVLASAKIWSYNIPLRRNKQPVQQ